MKSEEPAARQTEPIGGGEVSPKLPVEITRDEVGFIILHYGILENDYLGGRRVGYLADSAS